MSAEQRLQEHAIDALPPRWPRVAVFGAGAVGCWYGARLARAGAPVVLIGRPAHVEAIHGRGLEVESGGRVERVPIGADTQPEALAGAGLVLVCVKSGDTAQAGRLIAAHAPADATVVSMQNGVDNAEVLREAAGIDALAAVVYVAASMSGPGRVLHAGRGDLVIGEYGPAPEGVQRDAGRAARVAAIFERAGVACPVSEDVRAPLWTKLVINCVYNAVSALAQVRYRVIVGEPRARALALEIVGECRAVARADGVVLPDVDALHADAMKVGEAMSNATSSTAQDLARGRPTEIDSLNGYVVRRGQALGVPTPVNRTLLDLVKLRETSIGG